MYYSNPDSKKAAYSKKAKSAGVWGKSADSQPSSASTNSRPGNTYNKTPAKPPYKPYNKSTGTSYQNRTPYVKGQYQKKYTKKYSLPEDEHEFAEKFVEDTYVQTRPYQESSFQNLVEVAANKFNMGRQLTAIRICHEAKKALTTLLPESHQQVQVISFKNATLTLRTENASLRQRMHTKAYLLQETLNRQFQKEIIEKVSVQL